MCLCMCVIYGNFQEKKVESDVVLVVVFFAGWSKKQEMRGRESRDSSSGVEVLDGGCRSVWEVMWWSAVEEGGS